MVYGVAVWGAGDDAAMVIVADFSGFHARDPHGVLWEQKVTANKRFLRGAKVCKNKQR